ncbi:MAG TPA: Ig domain-containing protein [Candidatus Saccharimonadales bacterium]|nr:Ig domain-containing protein [Candidatus Saccharimonadales bacterium]
MTCGTDGVVSGTPSLQSNYYSEFTVRDSKGATATSGIVLTVIGPLAFQMAPNLPDVNIALPFGLYIGITGGIPPYNFTVIGGNLPPGVSLNNAGLFQGTPTTPGTYNFTVQVTDSFTPQFKISQAFTWNVLNGLVLPVQNLPDAVQNLPYAEFIQPAGGIPPYHYVLGQNSALPPGMHLDANSGKVSGTPPSTTVAYMDTMLVLITDSASPPVTINPFVSFFVQPALSFDNSAFPDGAKGLNYGGGITISGGRAPYKVNIGSGNLPDGVAVATTPYSNNFNLTGVPTADGLFKFKLQVTDSYETPNTFQKDYQIRISDQMTMGGPTYAQVLFNQNYSTTFPITGGFPPYTWHIDYVPPGFTFDTTTGTLSGSPTALSDRSSFITAHDSSTPQLVAPYLFFSLTVIPQLVIRTNSLPTVATGRNVYLMLAANGGGAPYTWTTTGSLPPGIKFGNTSTATGIFTGSPTTAGVYNFTVNLSDGVSGDLHQTASQQFIWTVKDPGQMTRNDTIAHATSLSNISLLASISPANDPSSTGPDVDVYSLQATPGSLVTFYVSPNNDFVQPPEPNSMQPILEVVDSTGKRYQTCTPQTGDAFSTYTLPCINGLPLSTAIAEPYYTFFVPGNGTTPLTYYIRVSDARGDARPDFIYSLSVYNFALTF